MNDNDMIITNVINEGNQNNVKICINADTYLEKIFLRNVHRIIEKYRFIMSGRILKTDIYIRLPS